MKQPRESFLFGAPTTGDTPITVEAEEGTVPISDEFQFPWVSKAELAEREANAAVAKLARQGKITIGESDLFDPQQIAIAAGVLVAAGTVFVAYRKGWLKDII